MHSVSIFYVLVFLYYYYENCSSESIYFMDVERPVVTYVKTSHVRSVTVTARRVKRNDPCHYLNVSLDLLFLISNDLRMDFYSYQYLTNRYRPSFVELHFGACDFIDKDPFMGSQVKRTALALNLTCPYPAGKYNLTNMAVPFVPKNFPFPKGRIYLNVSLKTNTEIVPITRAHIDMEIKQRPVKTSR